MYATTCSHLCLHPLASLLCKSFGNYQYNIVQESKHPPDFNHLATNYLVPRETQVYSSPNRFTCEGFLLLSKGCILGPRDFTIVSGFVFLHEVCFDMLWMLCPHDLTFVSHLTRLSSTRPWMLCPHDFTCVSHLSSTRPWMLCPAWFYARMILHLSPTCPRSSPTSFPLGSGCSARMILHVSPTCLP